MNRPIRTIIALTVIVVIFFLTYFLEVALRVDQSIKNAHQISQGQLFFDHNKNISIRLPHSWDKSHPNQSGVGHYHFIYALNHSPSHPLAIYLPKLSMNAQVSINGDIIGSGGSMVDPVSRYWNLPLYFYAPARLWHAGDNSININVAGFASGRSGLSPFFIGSPEVLFDSYQNHYLTLLVLDISSFAINLVLGLLILVWAFRTHDKALYFFGFAAVISSIPILDSFWTNVPVHRFLWRFTTHNALSLSMILFYLFMLRMLKRQIGGVEYFLIGYLTVGSISLIFAAQNQLLPWAKIVHLGSLLIILQLIFLSMRQWVWQADSLKLWLGGCMAVVLAFGLADWLPAVLGLEKSSPYIFYMGPVAFSIAVTLGLLARYVSAMQIQQNYNLQLQQSLDLQQQQLSKQNNTIIDLERDRAVGSERHRIIRELHDGLGGQLMGALALSETGNTLITNRIRYALDELRIIMDSLDPDADFETSLAMLRQRIEPELNKQNIKLIWKVSSPPVVFKNSPEKSLHGLRIIQESFVNILKYASASNITLELDEHKLAIIDNGLGFDTEQPTNGRGLSNIRWRAEQLGAKLDLCSSHKGTHISLNWRYSTTALQSATMD